MIIYSNQEKLKELLTTLNENLFSDFYKNKYAEVIKNKNLNIEDRLENNDADGIIQTFESLPYLTRKDITDTHPDKRLYIPKGEVSFVSYTSGTTDGIPLVMYWSQVADYFFEPSLGTASRTPLILHPALNKNFGHTFIQQCRQANVPVTPVFADFQNLVQSAIIAEKTSADAIYTTPTLATMTHEYIKKHYDPKKILLLVLFSETLTTLKKEILHKMYPNAQIANVYASSEVGQILFYPCKRMTKENSDEFHIIDKALVVAELTDDGELILTMNQNKAFPLIRYQTGDFFELSSPTEQTNDSRKNPCSCGLDTPVLKWAGRMDVDKIRLNGVEIKSVDIEYALQDCRKQIGDMYQLHFYSIEASHSESIKIIVEVIVSKDILKNKFGEIELAEKIKKALLDNWQLTAHATLQTAVDKGLFQIPQVKFVEELSLKTLKTRHIVNHAK